MTNHVNQNVNEILANHVDELTNALNEAVMIVVIDKSGKMIEVNDYFCKVSKFSLEEMKKRDYQLLHSDCHNSEFFVNIWHTISAGERWSGDICSRTKDGNVYWAKAVITPLLDKSNKPYQYVAIMKEMTDEKSLMQWEYLANYDELTKLPNRRKLNHLLSAYVLKAKMNKEKMAVAFLDIDQFKSINDNYGHLVGDRLLIEVANRLSTFFGEEERVFRQGGDEFIVLFDEIFNLEKQLAQLLRLFYEPIFIDHFKFFISVSIGVSIFPDHGDNQEKILECADRAMFNSKQTSGSTFRFYRNSFNEVDKFH